jgi:hypothetical protein
VHTHTLIHTIYWNIGRTKFFLKKQYEARAHNHQPSSRIDQKFIPPKVGLCIKRKNYIVCLNNKKIKEVFEKYWTDWNEDGNGQQVSGKILTSERKERHLKKKEKKKHLE